MRMLGRTGMPLSRLALTRRFWKLPKKQVGTLAWPLNSGLFLCSHRGAGKSGTPRKSRSDLHALRAKRAQRGCKYLQLCRAGIRNPVRYARSRAKKLNPEAVFLPVRKEFYTLVSDRVMEILRSYADVRENGDAFEQIS